LEKVNGRIYKAIKTLVW